MSSKSQPLAIVGISCLFPKADDLQAYWANIKNGVNAITPVPAGSHWNAADYFDADPKSPDHTYAQSGGFLAPVNFNPMEFGIAPKDIEATDTSQLLSLVAAQRALADAGYAAGSAAGEFAGRKFDRERTSVILGVTGALELVIPLGARLGHPIWRKALKAAGVEGTVAEDVVQRIADSYVGWQENSFPGLLGNVTAGRIANRLDLGGTNCVVDAACASSLAAIHLAGLELAAGRSDMVITGGVDTFNDIFMYMCFSKTPALSPTGDAKPFDRDCDGTVLGEGLGVLVLKRLADAERDGDRIYAVLKGIGSSSDGRSSAIYAPRAGGQKLALQRAYEDAGTAPATIGLIEAHGTGTKVGDATELSSLIEVFQPPRPAGAWCALGSVKSQIGHTKAAAGVAGIIKAAMALHQKVLPPTIKIAQPLEEAASARSPFYLNTVKRPWLPAATHPRRAGVSALGFGGTNFHCVLEEHGATKPAVDWDGDIEILAFGSESLGDLKAQLSAHRADSSWMEFRRESLHSRQQFRFDAEFRLLIIVTRESGRASLKDAALRMLEKNPDRTSWTAPAGIAFGSGKRHGKLGALFPGQGSQYAGMLRDLACQFPAMMEALADADEAFALQPSARNAKRLSDFIYPHPVFSEESRQQQEEALKATDIAQPALGAVSLGAFNVLNYFGVAAQAACGHSYGELLALCGAGRIDPEALHQLSNLRGRLMAGDNGDADRGAMIAVQADEQTVLDFLREENSQLVVANRNSPQQYVLAGPLEQIKRAVGKLTKRAIRSRLLQVSAAFHSPLVADARAPFAEALEGLAFDKGRMPVYANATGREYPMHPKQAREVLANQIVRPVNFMEQIQAMHADDVQTFIEIGPGHVLSDLVQSILPGREVETIALDASKGKRSGVFDLALALARLASLGHEFNLAKWENAPPPVEANAGKPALSVPLSGANYRAPTTPRPPVTAVLTSIENRTPKTADVTPMASRAAQEGILALQRLQEQTAQLHKQFLEGQESARRSIQCLLELRGGATIPQPVAPLAAAAEIVRQPPPVLPAPAFDRTHYERAVLEIVCDKTGYPVEMLTLGMGMDSDLGIDSIKRVEIMAALRARLPEAPEIKPEHLGSLQTLEQVVAFLANRQAVVPVKTGTQVLRSHISDTLLAVVSEKTGYPIEMLNLGMGMDSDLGIDSIKRVEIMAALRGKLPQSPEIKPEHLGSLHTLQQVVDFLIGQAVEPVMVPAPAAAPALQTASPQPKPSKPEVLRQIVRPVALSGVEGRETISLPAGAQVWLTDDGSELCRRIEERLHALRLIVHRGALRQGFSGNRAASLAALVILSPAGGSDDAFLKQAFRLIQRAGPALRKAGGAGAAILVTVSRLDGAFGFGDLKDRGDPVSGGLAGLVKTARHEWPEVHCKALDLDPEFTDAAAASGQIVAEIFRAGPVEVGISARGRVALEVAVSPIERAGVQPPLAAGDVVIVSGGARGVTGDAALALARAFRPKLVLLGRTELGESEPAWLQDLQTEAGIKKALVARKSGDGSPKAVEAKYREVLARREIRAQLGRLEAAGAQASYHALDVRDGAAMTRILSEVRRRRGAIHGLVHGAGVLADRRIEDKTEEQFDRVYGTKVTGLRNLLAALAPDALKVIALFSSYTGRVGRVGQVDYAAANEVLNKFAQMESRRRPDCRVVSVNWGPWNGGMATPGVRKLFEQEGIGLIEPAAGAEFLVRELCSADKAEVEILALAPSPVVVIPPELKSAYADSVAFVREVSVEALPCLESHVFNGRAVLPAALMVEWLAQAALHGNPGMAFHGLDNFKVLKGIVLEARQSVTVSLRTAAATRRDNLHVVPVRMTSRAGEGNQGYGRDILHAEADVLLTTDNLPAAPEPAVVDIPGGGYADAYALGVLFHGAALHGIERVEGIAERGVAALLKAASAPIKWMTHPLRGTWIADPLALDSAFQMMILWSTAHRGAPSLPSALGSYRQFVSVFPKGGCRAVIAVALGISAIAVATIQFFDRQGNLLASAEGCEFVMDAALRDAFRLNRLGLEK
jgi:acyl transferase domain-containing protein/NAD(P)-dependent dehydrogenase (short-subunit alcohol dehydrogenase family)/acyl carrier protein